MNISTVSPSKVIGDKRRWRQYKARTRAASRELPHGGRGAGAVPDVLRGGRTATARLSMFEDLADLFEQSAADGTPIREIVGEDPWSSSRRSSSNYTEGQWINRERERLTERHRRAPKTDTGGDPR